MNLPNQYVDTSALVKRYVAEWNSDAFEAYFVDHAPFLIASLTLVEIRCLLARKVREKHLTRKLADEVLAAVDTDIHAHHLQIAKIDEAALIHAGMLIQKFNFARNALPLSTLDALHLSVGELAQCTTLICADKTMLKAGARLFSSVINFSE